MSIKKDGCVLRCLDRDCNMPTFDLNATCCAHCGKSKLQAEHLGGVFNAQVQSFICSCGAELNDDATGRLRKALKGGVLGEIAPEAKTMIDLTDH